MFIVPHKQKFPQDLIKRPTESFCPKLGNASAIHINAAKKATIENNTITANNITSASTEIIKFNSIWDKDKPFDIYSTSVIGNNITTNMAAKGISTLYAGIGAPKYEIKTTN
ncbi:right-handed parallel beta-helix repeat-containing protein [Paenibacillus eucommiae]|uniref:Right handed beta helix domain-containing protein n=1 Tax=Paenibacillus eucommiae TaxID=1355755 RepID=A0ABS4INL3_9BACL|nr:right-handed parallel beta-helix repeat-containing protein [Paenibacillus eucommiae]MBP1989147.1 hypothetical protein [Paenibacillus eucommiae]